MESSTVSTQWLEKQGVTPLLHIPRTTDSKDKPCVQAKKKQLMKKPMRTKLCKQCGKGWPTAKKLCNCGHQMIAGKKSSSSRSDTTPLHTKVDRQTAQSPFDRMRSARKPNSMRKNIPVIFPKFDKPIAKTTDDKTNHQLSSNLEELRVIHQKEVEYMKAEHQKTKELNDDVDVDRPIIKLDGAIVRQALQEYDDAHSLIEAVLPLLALDKSKWPPGSMAFQNNQAAVKNLKYLDKNALVSEFPDFDAREAKRAVKSAIEAFSDPEDTVAAFDLDKEDTETDILNPLCLLKDPLPDGATEFAAWEIEPGQLDTDQQTDW